ncbi:MAG: threonine-phosphate decarboxylase CobD [Terriglobia bacterium]
MTLNHSIKPFMPAPHGGNVYEVSRKLGTTPSQLLDFSASINPLGMSRAAKRRLIESVDLVCHYPDSELLDLTRALARYYGVPAEQILIGRGTTELVYHLARALRPQRALLVTPLFGEFTVALALTGTEINSECLTESTGFALDIARIERWLTEEKVDLCVIANPNNPTGQLIDQKAIDYLIRVADERETDLLIDEAFIDFVPGASAVNRLQESQRLLILRSLTKFFGIPGCRVGCLLAHSSRLAELSWGREPWLVDTLAQVTAIASLEDQHYQVATRALVTRERGYLMERLQAISWLKPYPSVANFVLMRILDPMISAEQLAERLLADRILVRNCSDFGGLDSRFIRVAVRRREENGKLLTALENAFS